MLFYLTYGMFDFVADDRLDLLFRYLYGLLVYQDIALNPIFHPQGLQLLFQEYLLF